jgi:hypothetical protein
MLNDFWGYEVFLVRLYCMANFASLLSWMMNVSTQLLHNVHSALELPTLMWYTHRSAGMVTEGKTVPYCCIQNTVEKVYIFSLNCIENTTSNIVCVFTAAGTCLPSYCLATIRGDTQTHRQQGDSISLLLFFQEKEIRLKTVQDMGPTNLSGSALSISVSALTQPPCPACALTCILNSCCVPSLLLCPVMSLGSQCRVSQGGSTGQQATPCPFV